MKGGKAMYEVIPASSAEEARAKSMFQTGKPVIVYSVEVVPNADGTWTVIPSFVERGTK